MTPYQLVKAECANYRDDGCIARDAQENECLIAAGKRCSYFEKCLLPLADEPSPAGEPKLQGSRQKAADIYAKEHHLTQLVREERLCPDCGEPLPHRRRYCNRCRRQRAKAATRGRQRKLRENAVASVTV